MPKNMKHGTSTMGCLFGCLDKEGRKWHIQKLTNLMIPAFTNNFCLSKLTDNEF